jgi:hypothetical protein
MSPQHCGDDAFITHSARGEVWICQTCGATQPKCHAHCVLPRGHEGGHCGFDGEWMSADAPSPDAPRCLAEGVTHYEKPSTVVCRLASGHAGDHLDLHVGARGYSWPRAATPPEAP